MKWLRVGNVFGRSSSWRERERERERERRGDVKGRQKSLSVPLETKLGGDELDF